MQPAPLSSFLKSVIGFLTFISISFGVTYAVQTYATVQDAEQAAAAARAAMLELEK